MSVQLWVQPVTGRRAGPPGKPGHEDRKPGTERTGFARFHTGGVFIRCDIPHEAIVFPHHLEIHRTRKADGGQDADVDP